MRTLSDFGNMLRINSLSHHNRRDANWLSHPAKLLPSVALLALTVTLWAATPAIWAKHKPQISPNSDVPFFECVRYRNTAYGQDYEICSKITYWGE